MKRQIIGSLLLASFVFSPQAQATKLDDDFEQILIDLCQRLGPFGGLDAEGWSAQDQQRLNNLCLAILPGGGTPSTDAYVSSSNIGSSGATGKTTSSTSQMQVSSVKDRLAEIQEEEAIDQGGWGLLLTVHGSETEREETVNESGYESSLQGILVGGDYRFNDRFISGFALGYTSDSADFSNNTGKLDTVNNSLVGYFTYLPSNNAYLDAYVGYSMLAFDSERVIDFQGTPGSPSNLPTSTATGDYDGEQIMAGVSGGYDWHFGKLTLGAFAAFDISDTDIDSYAESGNTGLEFTYDKQKIESALTTLGINAGYDFNRRWGVLTPTFSVSAVHQSKDDVRDFALQPSFVPFGVTTPQDQTTVFNQTDEPDRDYLMASVGLIAALNSGTQFFVTYEQMSAHDFLDTWSLSAGVIIEAF